MNADRTALDLQKARTSLPITLDKQRLELEKKKFEREKANEKLTKLEHDRDLMKVESPADGIVYFGPCTARSVDPGRANDEQASQRRPGLARRNRSHRGRPQQYVCPRRRAGERSLANAPRSDRLGHAEGFEELHLPASLDEFSLVPAPEGKYFGTVLVDFARLKDTPMPSPGMNCKVKLTAYSTDSALTIPAKALQTDKQNDDQHYVWLSVSGAEKPVRRNVTIGHRTETTVEITDGLAEGDKVLRDAPKDEE